MLGRNEKEKGVNVQVLLRCRPFSEDELRNNVPQVVSCNEYQREVSVSQNIAGKHIDRVFTFDKVFGPNAQQRDLYDQAVVPIVNEVLEGFNCTIFAYGQTGTGKTYTMEGDCKRSKGGASRDLPPGAGVIPRAVKQIFDTLESQNAEYSVKVTFLELYNEEITDLLAPEDLSRVALEDKKKQLPLMEDGKGGVLVKGLEEEIVTSASEILTLIERGSAKRRTAETLLNKQSSRSHSLFSITIHIKEVTPEGEELIKCGKLNLVDLAGSENISRSGAREGRAREAGEINKSLLTLGRVISALVEHLGHVPYRDSKLTRLLRDSLGGRTKTCIIATVSPAVHCLEETLSTLDYAHRAKNIKNKPEVNQKMMKSTLIKDLYGEIERLKAEVYASREKNGVYIPKELYYQGENERKAMADQIEQMGVTLENYQKKIEELQSKYQTQVEQCTDLSNRLDETLADFNRTSKLLADSEYELQSCRYSVKERDFIISEQKKAENALARQACALRADLEKSQKDNASLFLKLAREEKMNAANRSTVDSFQADLTQQLSMLCNLVTGSVSQQDEHLQCVEKICNSLLEVHEKASTELKKKVCSSKVLCISHFEAVQNGIRLHNAGCNAGLDELSTMAASNSKAIQDLLNSEAIEVESLFADLRRTLTDHQVEMAHLAGELRERFNASINHMMNTSESLHEAIERLSIESIRLGNHAAEIDEAQTKCISEFQKAYEEQSRSDAEKLISEMTNLVSACMSRQKKMVGTRLCELTETVNENKKTFDGHVSTMDGITKDLKRKWEDCFTQAESDFKDNAGFTAAKHCRMELLLQKCVNTADTASNHWQRTQQSLIDIGNQHASTIASSVRKTTENNEQHDIEIELMRVTVEGAVEKSSEEIIESLNGLSEQERQPISEIQTTTSAHSETIKNFKSNHSQQAACIEENADVTFRQKYKDYEPSGSTPAKCEADIPSKSSIEALRAMPVEALQEKFQENNSVDSFPFPPEKESKPSHTTQQRSPLSQIN
ncbi:kinesin-like protein KIN-5C [Andrographis paniculata]|uniref:kinesin-like protein KIN-5C n=1 Tax=Andrographis paniculata TaxID=175694 RepID=UPI0021E707FD|nr:kinesin-like protein KIN-5C [Andrographis paniculata]